MRPRYPKTDKNHAEVVNQLRAFGFVVIDVSSLPVPALDCFVGGWSERHKDYTWIQCEIKTEAGQLNDAEAEYLAANLHLPIILVRRVEDVLHWFGRVT
jgi:hypothetical protein